MQLNYQTTLFCQKKQQLVILPHIWGGDNIPDSDGDKITNQPMGMHVRIFNYYYFFFIYHLMSITLTADQILSFEQKS